MGKQSGISSGATVSANDDAGKIYPVLILQSNLKMLRKICGLSMKDFGQQVGVTAQTIANLEGGSNNMSLMCYGSIMYFLDCVAECGANGITDDYGKNGVKKALEKIPGLNRPEISELEQKYKSVEDVMLYADSIKAEVNKIYIETKNLRSEQDLDKEKASDMIKRLLDRSPIRDLYTGNTGD